MISLKCKTCGGEISIDAKGELGCPYCGSRSHLSDIEFKEYKNFRLNLLNYLRELSDINADAADDSVLWNQYHDTVSFISEDGKNVTIEYMFTAREDGVDIYVARNAVIYIFKSGDTYKLDKMKKGISMLDYPSADIKNLSKYFPTIKSTVRLKDGGLLVAVGKPENSYPLFAFGSLRPEHVAWIVSRMENFCCVFEFSGIVHDGITINSVFINPRTHEAYLLGNWWKVRGKMNALDKKDLYDLRSVAGKLMGEFKDTAPEQFKDFLKDRPAEDAYTDFELWDSVIEKGFGGHRFTNFKEG